MGATRRVLPEVGYDNVPPVCVCMYVCVCIYVYQYVCIYTDTHPKVRPTCQVVVLRYTYIHTYINTHIETYYLPVWVESGVHPAEVGMFIQIHTRMHTYMHAYIHAYIQRSTLPTSLGWEWRPSSRGSCVPNRFWTLHKLLCMCMYASKRKTCMYVSVYKYIHTCMHTHIHMYVYVCK
jgi:hypothetical protein